MKKLLFALFSVALLAAACQKFDDSRIWEKLNEYEARIAKLEQQCEAINTNISSMQTVLEALQKKDYVTSVNPVTKEGVVVGYVIPFQNSGTITIYNGKDGKDGRNGTNGTNGADGHTVPAEVLPKTLCNMLLNVRIGLNCTFTDLIKK